MSLLRIFATFAVVAGGLASVRCSAGTLPWPDDFDGAVRRIFSEAPAAAADAPYEMAFRYLLTGFIDRARPDGSMSDQPGARSRNGSDADAMESFSRLAPVAAAWLAGGRERKLRDLRGREVDLVDWLRKGIVAGTTVGGPGYWGQIDDLDQKIVEAADIARALWIARDTVAKGMTQSELAAVAEWLNQVERAQVPDNNWHLFPVIVREVLASLRLPNDEESAKLHFARFTEFRLGDGWYSDGPSRADVDWYNVWAIQYELRWLRRISPGYGGDLVAKDLDAFARTTPYLLSPQGIPIMGRSVCYRLAAPTIAVAASLPGPDGSELDPGLGRRALDATWAYFVRNGAFADGTVTQGYCGPDMRILDNYSGPSSCLWSLRPLTFAFLASFGDPFWTAMAHPLPVEVSDFRVEVPAARWTLVGRQADLDVRIAVGGADPWSSPVLNSLEPMAGWRTLASAVLWWRPYRPPNHVAKYDLSVYSSLRPFCGCLGGEVADSKFANGQNDAPPDPSPAR